jgi:hypothetical protein
LSTAMRSASWTKDELNHWSEKKRKKDKWVNVINVVCEWTQWPRKQKHDERKTDRDRKKQRQRQRQRDALHDYTCHDGVETMSDGEHGGLLELRAYRLLNEGVGRLVDRWRGLWWLMSW